MAGPHYLARKRGLYLIRFARFSGLCVGRARSLDRLLSNCDRIFAGAHTGAWPFGLQQIHLKGEQCPEAIACCRFIPKEEKCPVAVDPAANRYFLNQLVNNKNDRGCLPTLVSGPIDTWSRQVPPSARRRTFGPSLPVSMPRPTPGAFKSGLPMQPPCGRSEHLPINLWAPIQINFPHHPILLPNFLSQHTKSRLEDRNGVETWNLELWDLPQRWLPCFIWRMRQSTKGCFGLSIKDAEFLSFFSIKNLSICPSVYRHTYLLNCWGLFTPDLSSN